eukprot:TRINITY_DN3769_c0_g1_i1.p1 TRINITY_DN3769_c0_g1~~TRINITY_DN3769_c0_g1_i1.p1  ORF type:complete len:319 (-),score=25.49 TRINITY_DN3769_c0_g1_i1:245-1201(-)
MMTSHRWIYPTQIQTRRRSLHARLLCIRQILPPLLPTLPHRLLSLLLRPNAQSSVFTAPVPAPCAPTPPPPSLDEERPDSDDELFAQRKEERARARRERAALRRKEEESDLLRERIERIQQRTRERLKLLGIMTDRPTPAAIRPTHPATGSDSSASQTTRPRRANKPDEDLPRPKRIRMLKESVAPTPVTPPPSPPPPPRPTVASGAEPNDSPIRRPNRLPPHRRRHPSPPSRPPLPSSFGTGSSSPQVYSPSAGCSSPAPCAAEPPPPERKTRIRAPCVHQDRDSLGPQAAAPPALLTPAPGVQSFTLRGGLLRKTS